jgi:hypothetical protein
VLLCKAALIRLTTQKTYSRSLQSRVGAVGLCPLTPSVAASVGTIGKRASSWLSSVISPAWALFVNSAMSWRAWACFWGLPRR